MITPHHAAPLELLLPGGHRAAYVSASEPPAYTLDGALLAVDVVIPPDLAAAGWHWHGSCLAWQDDARRFASVDTATFPPPGWPGERQTCFDAAREIERVRAEIQAAVAARPAKKAKRKAPIPIEQTMMELL